MAPTSGKTKNSHISMNDCLDSASVFKEINIKGHHYQRMLPNFDELIEYEGA